MKMRFMAKLHRITIVTLTRLLAMRIVARSLSGAESSFLIDAPLGDSSSSSHCEGVSEKYAISLPETNPETTRAMAAHTSATMQPADGGTTVTSCSAAIIIATKGDVAGKGSVSKSL